LAGAPLVSVVDDDPWARSGLEELIASCGYEVRSFGSAEEFIGSGCMAQTRCLITDLNMPKMDGLELQAFLRRAGHKTPIIIVTAYPTEEHRVRALRDCASSFLSKPLDESVLIDCVTNAIETSLP
jgi:FixJ family two-component response regulator